LADLFVMLDKFEQEVKTVVPKVEKSGLVDVNLAKLDKRIGDIFYETVPLEEDAKKG